ncbi:MAG: 50S ribosomal protein L10 [Mycoplasmatota bacterium]|nr:50S ribosomal protein L10 [Mycoplasmatota bacterium]
MANAKIIEQKATVVSEIKDRFENAKSVVMFDYRGLSVSEVTELRKKLRENGADYKVYKNTLTKRALDELNINMDEYLAGPSAVTFGTDELSIVKILNDFSKEHQALELKAGIIEGKVASLEDLKRYAAIPSRDMLLTMLAAGLMGTVRDLSICLDLYTKEKENN